MRVVARKCKSFASFFSEGISAGDVSADDEVRRVGGKSLVGSEGDIQPQGLRVGRVVYDPASAYRKVAAGKRVGFSRICGEGQPADRSQIIVVRAGAAESCEFDWRAIDRQRVVQPVCVRRPCAIASIPHEEGSVVEAQCRGVCRDGERSNTSRSIESAGIDVEFVRRESSDVPREVGDLPLVVGG